MVGFSAEQSAPNYAAAGRRGGSIRNGVTESIGRNRQLVSLSGFLPRGAAVSDDSIPMLDR
jgi:hypothetical protein